MKFKTIITFLLLPILTSCVHTKIIDDLTIVTAGGIDLIDDKIEFTIISPQFLPDNNTMDLVQNVRIPKEENILEFLDRQSSRPVLMGDMDTFLFGENIARDGIFPVIDTLQRNPNIGSRLLLAITTDPLGQFMSGKYGNFGNAIYITNMLEHNMKYRDLPLTNIHLFSSDFFQKDVDAFLPILKQIDQETEQEKLELSGVGVFNEKKLTYILPAEDIFEYK